MNPSQNSTSNYYRALTRKMILTVIIVSFAPMILVSGVIFDQFREFYKEKVYAHLRVLVRKHQRTIDSFLNEKMSDIRFLAKSYYFEELRDATFLQQRLALLQEEYDTVFEDLGVIDARGIQVAYAGPFELARAKYSEADWFKKAIGTQYFISDVFLGLRGLPHFIVAVRQKYEAEHWIFRATIDFAFFNNLVTSIRIGKTGFAFILNREGELQTKQLFDILPSKEIYMDLIRKGKDSTEDVHIFEQKDALNKKNIYVSAFLKNGDWLLVYQQESADAFADLNRAQYIAVIIFLVGGIAIITMAFVLSRRMVNRIARADREKEMMNQQVIETGKLASIGELAAGIAHEINNPVAIMVEEAGWIQDLLEEEEFRQSENLDEFNRALKQINTQGKRCKEITHKLLSFARKTDSRKQQVQINELIEDVVGLSSQRAKYSNVVISTKLEKDLPALQASETELQQVFMNLINNALDAMEKKGGTLEIASQLNGAHIEIDIADNGPGIPEANLARIFDPFFTTKPVGKGTGLGLSICYGIIKKMGGDIDVRSVVDMGTKFRIRLPLTRSAGETGAEKSLKGFDLH
ncbi:MAG: two-component sensor histidine kinase [Proteobacteria bacterium]|nr:two-component sensor histidine kinase [Pseudomonadota bacterium]